MDMTRLKIYSAKVEACGAMVPTPSPGLDRAAGDNINTADK
jgi:hypothetical protein